MKELGRVRRFASLLFTLALLATACSKKTAEQKATPTPSAGQSAGLAVTTPAGTKPVDRIVWSLLGPPAILDPIYAADYSQNPELVLLCESLLRQQPDGSIAPGLADLSITDPTTLVFTLKPGVTFWDGNPVTPEDVVYSLERNTDKNLGSFYGGAFSRVRSIEATGSNQVTITLTEPDYWLPSELASMGGIVLEKKFVEEKGHDFGTPAGGLMCTGAYKLESWKTGDVLSAVRNDNYWNTDVKPLVREIDFKGIPNQASLTSGLLNGSVNGSYFPVGLLTLDQLKASHAVSVTEGASWSVDAFIVSSFDGVLGDVRVRRALSMAVDRRGIIDTVYKGAALMPKAFAGPDTWTYGGSVLQDAWNALPDLTQNIDQAKQLVQEAGATGKTITIGMSSEIESIATEASAYQAAAEAIGLHVKLDSVSGANYIGFFIDPKARANVDGFFTVDYGDFADPAAILAGFVLPGSFGDYSGYENPQVTKLLDEARGTADETARAQKVAEAQALVMQDLPRIPNAIPSNVLVMSSNLTGAVASWAHMFAPWADELGGT